MSVYHKADPGELIQWVTHESRSSAASNSGLIRIGTQPRTADAWHHDSCRPRGVVTRDFSAILTVRLTVFPFEFRPRTFTIGFYGKKPFISELMILECSFPLTNLLAMHKGDTNTERKVFVLFSWLRDCELFNSYVMAINWPVKTLGWSRRLCLCAFFSFLLALFSAFFFFFWRNIRRTCEKSL